MHSCTSQEMRAMLRRRTIEDLPAFLSTQSHGHTNYISPTLYWSPYQWSSAHATRTRSVNFGTSSAHQPGRKASELRQRLRMYPQVSTCWNLLKRSGKMERSDGSNIPMRTRQWLYSWWDKWCWDRGSKTAEGRSSSELERCTCTDKGGWPAPLSTILDQKSKI